MNTALPCVFKFRHPSAEEKAGITAMLANLIGGTK